MRIVLAALLMLATNAAWADWVKVAESDTVVHYLDPATIHQDGDLRQALEIQDLKARAQHGELSLRTLFEFDCNGGRVRVLSASAYSGPMAMGKIMSVEIIPDNWDPIPPGTLAEGYLRVVCAR
ncbi:MAG: surface-adhesin E family protein [Betaproteobacteria bacterium]